MSDMNTFDGKQWKALMAHCLDKKGTKKHINDNLRWPVLCQGHLVFTDSFSIASVKVPIVTVHAADPEYVSGGLMRLDHDLFEKVLVKDIFTVTEDGLFKNGKQISEWRYINTASTAGFVKLIQDTEKNAKSPHTEGELKNYIDHFWFDKTYVSRMAEMTEAFSGLAHILPSYGKLCENGNYQMPTMYCEYGLDNTVQSMYAPKRY